MILLDTSIWADHFRSGMDEAAALIQSGGIAQHPFVTGELALGNPPDRLAIVALLDAFPQAAVVSHDNLMLFVEQHQLGNTGIGFVDANLLASAALANDRVWTKDKRLLAQAERLSVAYQP